MVWLLRGIGTHVHLVARLDDYAKLFIEPKARSNVRRVRDERRFTNAGHGSDIGFENNRLFILCTDLRRDEKNSDDRRESY